MMSSARPGSPDGVANTTSCPAADSTCQLTATSVGSKSQAGSGMRTVTIGVRDTTDEPRTCPEHRPPNGDSVDRMADAEAETGTAAIFSADDGIEELWVQAYQGEVLGEALFGAIADRMDDAEHADKMRVLATLELRTKEAVAPALARVGISTAPDSEMLGLAEALAPDSAAQPWAVVMGSLEAITGQFIPLYERIAELDPAEREAADLLVAHEAALRDFARAELAGNTATSLEPVTALAHMR